MSVTNAQHGLQQRLFDQILSKYPTKTEAVTALMKLLNVSKPSLYRKMNGKMTLKLNEFLALAKHYQLSLDNLIASADAPYSFRYIENYELEHSGIDTPLNAPLLEQLKNAKNAKLYYLGAEIPVFYLCRYPILIYFKEQVWKRNNRTDQWLDYSPIDFNAIRNKDILRYRKAWSNYAAIPSYELWDKSGFQLLVEQIRHCYDIGILYEQDLKLLVDRLEKLVDRLERMLNVSSKLLNDQVQNMFVYDNPILSPTWYFVGESEHLNYFQGAFDNPNSLLSYNTSLIKKAHNRFVNQQEQCLLIAGTGTVNRSKLLNSYRRDIRGLLSGLL